MDHDERTTKLLDTLRQLSSYQTAHRMMVGELTDRDPSETMTVAEVLAMIQSYRRSCGVK